jgi:hypothetical protein
MWTTDFDIVSHQVDSTSNIIEISHWLRLLVPARIASNSSPSSIVSGSCMTRQIALLSQGGERDEAVNVCADMQMKTGEIYSTHILAHHVHDKSQSEELIFLNPPPLYRLTKWFFRKILQCETFPSPPRLVEREKETKSDGSGRKWSTQTIVESCLSFITPASTYPSAM